jgi:hypothetical protein
MAITDSILSMSGVRAVLLDYLPFNPKNRLHDVRNRLSMLPGVRRAVVDISSMSKLAIMLVLSVCRTLDLEVRVLYTEAQSYAPSQEDFDSAREKQEIHRPTLQVFTGVHGVVRVDSLASVAMQGQPTAALVFMSFNDALTQVLLNTVYPSRLFLINGRPPLYRWREEATAWIHDRVRREWEEDNPLDPSAGDGVLLPKRVVSTLYYRETVALLLDLYWTLSAKHRILLAPAGSKMQAVGCYIVKALHPDIHIEYPSPEGFSQEYSSGIGTRWVLDLGRFSKRLSTIANAERREYLEIPT